MRRLAAFTLLVSTAFASAHAARPIQFAQQAPAEGALILPLSSLEELESRASMLDAPTRDSIARALTSADFRYRSGSSLTLRGIGPWSQILIVGAKSEGTETVRLQSIGGKAAQDVAAENGPVTLVATGLGDPAAAAQIAVGAELGAYSFDTYRSPDPERPRSAGQDAPMTIVTSDPQAARQQWENQGKALADASAFTRDLIREPGNVLYPEIFVERTRQAFRNVRGVTIEALDVPEMERQGMGAILSVGKGSSRPPRMLIVSYRGADGAPVVLAGKGITFDSGGISLKPGSGMAAMKGDMAGAAAVVGTVLSLARSRAPVNVVAIAALAENLPGPTATRPGDVVRAMNGKSIEITNTDAEGRL